MNLTEMIQACRYCSLSGNRDKENGKVVVSRGKGSPYIMIIGEAPGFEEMKQGIPFCGRSGKLLDECLEKNNIDNYIITNMVKCHPPDNRAPTHEEIQTCEMWLLNQISEMKPKRIVLLGAIALKYFFPTERISLANGKVFKWAGIDCIPMYHPAYILRNGNKMRDEYIKGFDIINKMEAC